MFRKIETKGPWIDGEGGGSMTSGVCKPRHYDLAGAYLVLYWHRNDRKAGDRAAVFEKMSDTKI